MSRPGLWPRHQGRQGQSSMWPGTRSETKRTWSIVITPARLQSISDWSICPTVFMSSYCGLYRPIGVWERLGGGGSPKFYTDNHKHPPPPWTLALHRPRGCGAPQDVLRRPFPPLFARISPTVCPNLGGGQLPPPPPHTPMYRPIGCGAPQDVLRRPYDLVRLTHPLGLLLELG